MSEQHPQTAEAATEVDPGHGPSDAAITAAPAVPDKPVRPAGVPEKFWNPEGGTVRTEALLKSYLELERKLGSMGPSATDEGDQGHQTRLLRALGVPESPDQYQIEPHSELIEPDPAINAKLHEAGFTERQAQLVYDLAADHLLPVLDHAIGQLETTRETERLAARFGGEAVWRTTAQQIKTWGQANLAQDVFETLASSYDGVLAIHQMMQAREPAGKAGTGSGKTEFLEFSSLSINNRTSLSAKTGQPDSITTAQRIDPTDKIYALFTIANASAELRDFLGVVTDTSTSVALGTPDLITIGATAFDEFVSTPFGSIDVYEVGLYTRVLTLAELDQLETYLRSGHQIIWSPGYLDSSLAWWHDDWSAFTLTGSLVDQWNDRSGKSRHWTASASTRPDKTIHAGNIVVRLDGVDDVLSMTGTLPALQPFTVAVIYRVRNRVDFEGVLSAAAATGVDHTSFWTFETAAAASNNMQLFGRSVESGGLQMALTRADGGVTQIAIWTANAGNATLRDRTGAISDSYGGSFGTPAALVLGARYNAGPFNHAEIDVMGTVGVTTALAASDQLKLIDWASAKWGV